MNGFSATKAGATVIAIKANMIRKVFMGSARQRIAFSRPAGH